MMIRRVFSTAAVILMAGVMATSAVAQSGTAAAPHRQVISANPFGLLLEFFNAEYERVVGTSSTVGVGGSFLNNDGDDYLNADVFWRFYPSGRPLDGWAFGVKAGVTDVSNEPEDSSAFFGYGFDVNRSWLLGVDENFYVGVGFGLKRLFGETDELGLEIIPTIRIVNIGLAF
jgi:hypothetical protein